MAKARIGEPCSPCKLEKRIEMKAYKVTMSCGGGIGGSIWREYLKKDIMATENLDQIVQVETIFGEKKKINLRYVVASKQVKIVHDCFDVTGHANYYEKVCNSSHMDRWIEVGIDVDIQYVNDFVFELDEKNCKVIRKDTETI